MKRILETLSRRRFLEDGGAGALAIGPDGSWALGADNRAGAWSFPMLGNLRIGRPEHLDMHWLAA